MLVAPASPSVVADDEGSLWALLNAARPFDCRALRVGCAVLTPIYGIVALLRYDPEDGWLAWALRGLVCAYGLLGAAGAPRFTWPRLRAYTLGLTVLVPLVTAVLNGRHGHPVGSLPFLGLASFVPFVFLQTAQDFVIATGAFIVGHALVLTLLPPVETTLRTVAIVLATGLGTGAAAGFVLLVYRVQLDRSLRWWHEACVRERRIREFGELTAAALRGAPALDAFAERLRAAYAPDGGCVIVLADDGGTFRVASTSDAATADGGAADPNALPPHLAALLWEIVAGGVPLRHDAMPPALREVLARRVVPGGRTLASLALPLVLDDTVAGVIWLFSRDLRRQSDADVLALQAMARQLGIALANARLLERLRRALSAKSEFLNTMSHELRSPLHVILGYAEMIAAEAPGAEIPAWCERIETSARELLQLVENTMNAARLDAGKVTLHEEVFLADEVVNELRDAVAALPEARRGTPVRWHCAPGLPAIRLDRLKLKEILQNLVSNALKFTPRGEVAVTIDRDGPDLRLAVRDTGLGIPPEAQARIFDMFERVEDPSARDRPGGVGLGLHIVRSLVQLMGGRVDVSSELGKGSCFTVRLPLARAAPHA